MWSRKQRGRGCMQAEDPPPGETGGRGEGKKTPPKSEGGGPQMSQGSQGMKRGRQRDHEALVGVWRTPLIEGSGAPQESGVQRVGVQGPPKTRAWGIWKAAGPGGCFSLPLASPLSPARTDLSWRPREPPPPPPSRRLLPPAPAKLFPLIPGSAAAAAAAASHAARQATPLRRRHRAARGWGREGAPPTAQSQGVFR